MVDLTDPSPLVMTNFERVATCSAFFAVLVMAILDIRRKWARRTAAAPSSGIPGGRA